MPASEASDEGAKALAEIDRVIHQPARLDIVVRLYVVERADFLYLMGQTGLTWGNLSSHLSKLEAAGYVEVEKEFVGKKPRTTLRLTDEGRAALQEYRRAMSQVLDEVTE